MIRYLCALAIAFVVLYVSTAFASDVTNLNDGKYSYHAHFWYTTENRKEPTEIGMFVQADDESECYPKIEHWWSTEGHKRRGRNPRLTGLYRCERR